MFQKHSWLWWGIIGAIAILWLQQQSQSGNPVAGYSPYSGQMMR